MGLLDWIFWEFLSAKKVKIDRNRVSFLPIFCGFWRLKIPFPHLGFQGTDPATDFRGMGRLGLECMLYFIENYSDSKNFILKSNHKQTGFPFAMLCINLTALLLELLEENHEKLRLYLYRVYGTTEIVDCKISNLPDHEIPDPKKSVNLEATNLPSNSLTYYEKLRPESGDLIQPILEYNHVVEIFGSIFIRLLLDFKNNFWKIEQDTDVFKFNQIRDQYKKIILTEGRSCVF